MDESSTTGEAGDESFEDVSPVTNNTNNSRDVDNVPNTVDDEITNYEPDVTDDENLLSGEESDMSHDSSQMSDLINDNWKEGVVEDVPSITCVEQYTELNGINLGHISRGSSLNAIARCLVCAAYAETASFNDLAAGEFALLLGMIN
ncbi:unnamed protein product [Rotaria sp. Silwood2]|nr:unnamed protein product [Rotaria sp. Silwood2]CAF2895393.1 unnamed protein product [Rotaria sp. Silwood2]CAF2939320.1 unnamed protein product [Rotaria sp. Silwood2]CAF3359264.1 unnamed protein product [Rotaria sp. Silwood2]CAF4087285.1 unnamed protein product [Rotaria sp. Silwood2]